MRVDPRDKTTHQMVPAHSDLLVLVPDDGETDRLLIDQAPPWVTAWVERTPAETEGEAVDAVFGGTLDALGEVGRDVLRDGLAVEDYFVEFTDAKGNRRGVMLTAQRADDYRPLAAVRVGASGPAVLIRLRDVTQSLVDRNRLRGVGVFHGIVGQSPAMLSVFYKIEVYGPTNAAVVITGETGTGKELVARALHDRSPRRDQPFVAVNCTALSEDLFESELFGHERGAFTGAVKSHKGRFERANEGTLFLDEIGEMPGRTQAKLLRALEQGTIERVGSEHEQRVDVRILAATNISLEHAVAARRFRADLYHRLSVLRIHVPALRERPGDIPLLVDYTLENLGRRYGRPGVRLTPEAVRLLSEYHWPGNVRELRNVLERVFVETQSDVIGGNAFREWVRERDYLSAGGWNVERLEDQRATAPIIIPPQWPAGPPAGAGTPPYPLTRAPGDPSFTGSGVIEPDYRVSSVGSRKPKELTEDMVRRAFADADGNATKAARLLGVHKATLYRKMKSLNLTREDLEKPAENGDTGGAESER